MQRDVPSERPQGGGWIGRALDWARERDVGFLLTAFLFSRMAIAATGYLANLRVEKFRYYTKVGHWLDPFFQWDAPWYLALVRQGYSYAPGETSNVNFFPLFPILTRAVGWICGDDILSGFIVSNLACLAACFYLHRIALDWGGDRALARAGVCALLVFPTSFFLATYYTESLFVWLAAASYYHARRRQWAAAGLLGFFCCLTRQVGVILLAPLALELLRIDWGRLKPDWSQLRHAPWLLLVPAGLAAYMAYLGWRFGEPLAFAESARAWGKYLVPPWVTLSVSLPMYGWFDNILYLGSLAVALASIVSMIACRLPLSAAVFAAALLGAISCMNILESAQRYILSIFTMYPALAWPVARHDGLRFGLGAMSALLLGLFTVLFVSGYRMY